MVVETGNGVIVRSPLSVGTPSRRPLIVDWRGEDIVNSFLEALKTDAGRDRVIRSIVRAKSGATAAKLHLPSHGHFYFALAELNCEQYGFPRLDPAKVEDAGIVVRRVATDSDAEPLLPEVLESWALDGKTVLGWTRFGDSADLDVDPEPGRRARIFRSANIEINRRLRRLPMAGYRYEESVLPAFVAPPEICAEAGRTFLIAMIPVTSSEISETAPPTQVEESEIRRGYPSFFVAGPERGFLSGQDYTDALVRMHAEYGMFGNGVNGTALRELLNELTLSDGSKAGDFLKRAFDALADSRTLPVLSTWPAVSEPLANRIFATVRAAVVERTAEMTPGIGRFEDPRDLYRARLFARVKHDEHCPQELIWSEPTERFRIAAWWEDDGPPTRILLPDVDLVKRLKPTVSFQMPASLFDMLKANDPKEVVKGNGSSGGAGIGLGWICSFNLPVIFLCAFLVLNIFLSLFDIIFRWMLFIKICIPIPYPKQKP